MSHKSLTVIAILLSTVHLVRSQVFQDIENNRICEEEKDFVDAVVFFDDHFYVIIGDNYYDYQYVAGGFRYLSDGPQVYQLRDYDRRWLSTPEVMEGDKTVNVGRYLGGFYQHPVSCGNGTDLKATHYRVLVDEIPFFNGSLHNSLFASLDESVVPISKRQVPQQPPDDPNAGSANDSSSQEPVTDNSEGGSDPDDTTQDSVGRDDEGGEEHPNDSEEGFFEEDFEIDPNVSPFEDIHQCVYYMQRMAQIQVIFFADKQALKEFYHIQKLNQYGLGNIGANSYNASLLEPYSYLIDMEEGLGELYRREELHWFLPPDAADQISHERLHLPVVHDFKTLTVFIIINGRTDIDGRPSPILYYNSYKYRQIKKTWKSIKLDDRYIYTAFLAKPSDRMVYVEMDRDFTYYALAEPYRVASDDTRGPTYLFELQFIGRDKPQLVLQKDMKAMDLFECVFPSISSEIGFYVFGVIIAILVIIFVAVLSFAVVNNFCLSKHQRLVLRRNKTESESTTGTSRVDLNKVRDSSAKSEVKNTLQRSENLKPEN